MYVIAFPDGTYYRDGAPAPVLHVTDASAFSSERQALLCIADLLTGRGACVLDLDTVHWATTTAD